MVHLRLDLISRTVGLRWARLDSCCQQHAIYDARGGISTSDQISSLLASARNKVVHLSGYT